MSQPSESHRRELIVLYIATFLLRTGFGGAIILFDWTLIWAIEHSLGIDQTASVQAILLISFAAITYYIAEILMTGYYGNRADKTGAKPILMYATIGATVVLLFYSLSSYFYVHISNLTLALILMTIYLALIHFIHGVFASAKVAPTLGFINSYSTDENRTLHMSFYDNAILYGRAVGIFAGGFIWIAMKVDAAETVEAQATQIMKTYPFLALIVLVAVVLLHFGMKNIEVQETDHKFSFKEDIKIAATVMLEPSRRPMLLPWISIAALIGSASLWGPTVSFILSSSDDTHRGYNALIPLLIILVGLALPAPLWGLVADRKGKKFTLKVGLYGLPVAGVLGLLIGYPFFKDDLSLSNIYLLLSILPAAFMFSAFIPVLMGALGDTAEKDHDGKVMSGYHFVIAAGELFGILVGGLVIGLFAMIQEWTGIFGDGQHGYGIAILMGFVLFEGVLVVGMIIGILKLPDPSD